MMKGLGARLALIVFLMSAFCVATQSGTEAGKFWVNISQTGPTSYSIRISISAGEALQVRTVRAPSIVDASELATKTEVRPLGEAQVSIPVLFIGEGIGRLWIAVNSVDDESKEQYLVFDVFNAVRGSEINDHVNDAIGRWRDLSTSSVMQFGRTPIKCDKDLPESINDTELFGERKALNGLIFVGTAKSLDGSVTGLDGSEWGLQFVNSRVGRVASFIEVGQLDPLPKQASNQSNSGNDPNKANRTEPKPERTETQPKKNESNRSNPKPRETKPKQPEPKTGPYSGAGPAATIQGLSVRKDWVASAGGTGGSGAGHFGETVVTLPREIEELASVDTIELVLEIKTVGTAPGMGRISMSHNPMLANARGSGVWFAERYQQQGELLGEFDLRYDGPEYRFDVTNLVQSNPGDRYFVAVLNLSRTALEIVNIRLEVKGKY